MPALPNCTPLPAGTGRPYAPTVASLYRQRGGRPSLLPSAALNVRKFLKGFNTQGKRAAQP
nr:MAG TPA: hypothetical protein [Caudoviricetes sp.]DAM37648.1 MAG TPA: hypothetical protein [Caudoviricetes sp.]